MAVLGRLLVSSAERLDLPDFLSIDSYTQGDFKYLMKSFVGDEKPYILKGFDVINPQNAIGTQNISIRVSNSVMYYPGSAAGPFFYGLEEGNLQAAPLVPELRKNSTNYVYLILSTTDAAKDTRAFWDPDKNGGEGGEFTQDVNTQTLLSAQVNVSVSSFPENTVPVCKVVVGPNFIESIEDARDMMFRLGTGGLVPNPLHRHDFRDDPLALYARKEPNTKMTSALDPNPFFGGDKNIYTLKEWMDVVMTKFSELGGTTYWYEDVGAFNIVNTFKDALASSVKSKGTWSSSESNAGDLYWSEDIVIQSTADKRDVILRAGNRTLDDNQVMFIDRVRDVNINTVGMSVDWFNSVNHVNGPIGSFENLNKGDWIKKSDDNDAYYLRVEEFFLGLNQSGGIASPGTARSIRLSEPYAGNTESKQALYTKGIYLPSDVSITERSDLSIADAAGNFYWLALRSDTIMSAASITTTTLNCDISGHDGTKAKVLSPNHGLADDQELTITGTINFNGTYTIEVEDAHNFYIYLSGGPFADESGEAHYATCVTQPRSTVNGLQLESANHCFNTGEIVTISDTTNYNGDVKVFAKNLTTFTFAVPSAIATETTGLVTAVEMYVRTEASHLKLPRGATKNIGTLPTDNLISLIGIDSVTQNHPNYSTPLNYNTIDGYVDYNSTPVDSIISRVSKLTGMMADKAQDKTITYKLSGINSIQNTVNGLARDLSFVAKPSELGTLEFIQPSTANRLTITLTGAISLLEDQVAYITLNRNADVTVNLTSLTVCDIAELPLDENIFLFALRRDDNNIILWDATPVRVYSTAEANMEQEIETISVPAGGLITSGQSFNINAALDAVKYYVWFNVDAAGNDPYLPGQIAVEVAINSTDTAVQVAATLAAELSALSDFSVIDNTDGTITVTRTAAGKTTDSTNNDVGGTFNIAVNQAGTGSPLNYVADGDPLEVAIKKLDDKLFAVENSLPDEAYEESIDIAAPVASGTNISLPVDSRNSNIVKGYVVGAGQLEMFLNGQYMYRGTDWSEVGSAGDESTEIQILQDLVIGDTLIFRLDNTTMDSGTGGSGGSGEANTASNVGAGAGVFKVKAGYDLQFRSIVAGSGVSISQNSNDITISSASTPAIANIAFVNASNYTATPANDVMIVTNNGTDLNITLPTAVGNGGKMLYIKKIDSGNTINVKTVLNQTIDGVNATTGSWPITTQWLSLTLVSDGSNWFII